MSPGAISQDSAQAMCDELAAIAVAVGRSKDGTGRDCDWFEIAEEVKEKLAHSHALPTEQGVRQAAVAFRESLVPRADHLHLGHYPMWYGWALYDAFIAGAKCAQSASAPKESDRATSAGWWWWNPGRGKDDPWRIVFVFADHEGTTLVFEQLSSLEERHATGGRWVGPIALPGHNPSARSESTTTGGGNG